MGEFSAGWLALREPADVAARSAPLVHALSAAFGSRRHLEAVDLGCGTGANLRYLLPRLPMVHRWRAIDYDRELLDALPDALARWGAATGTVVRRSGRQLALGPAADAPQIALVEADLRASPTWLGDHADLVTASALLDLVSAPWVESLVSRVRALGAAVLFALSYDGRMRFEPTDADDDRVRELVNAHQRTGKVFGPALGPDATHVVCEQLRRAGYVVHAAPSDWVLTAAHAELLRALVRGWARAAAEMAPDQASRLLDWQTQRCALVDRGQLAVVVGHQDVTGWPESF